MFRKIAQEGERSASYCDPFISIATAHDTNSTEGWIVSSIRLDL